MLGRFALTFLAFARFTGTEEALSEAPEVKLAVPYALRRGFLGSEGHESSTRASTDLARRWPVHEAELGCAAKKDLSVRFAQFVSRSACAVSLSVSALWHGIV
jgi:hypothetical protein